MFRGPSKHCLVTAWEGRGAVEEGLKAGVCVERVVVVSGLKIQMDESGFRNSSKP